MDGKISPAAEPAVLKKLGSFRDVQEFAEEWDRITAFLRRFEHLDRIILAPTTKTN